MHYPDCLSWYVSDTSQVITKHITRTNNEITKNKGASGLFQEMIQTWVTYELVKVIHIFGLGPACATHIREFAPNLYDYLFYLEDTNENKDFENKAKYVQEQLIKNTLHSRVFVKGRLVQKCESHDPSCCTFLVEATQGIFLPGQ
jgi:hypothetical protein